MKKLLSFMLALAMCAALILPAVAETPQPEEALPEVVVAAPESPPAAPESPPATPEPPPAAPESPPAAQPTEEPEATKRPRTTENPNPDYSAFEGKNWDELIATFFEEKGVTGDRVSLGYYNTVTGEEHYYNGDDLRIGASIYKLPLMMYFAERYYLGEIKGDTMIGPYKYDDIMNLAIRYSSNPAGEAMQNTFESYEACKTAIGKYMDLSDLSSDSEYYTTNEFNAKMMISCLKNLVAEPERFPELMDNLLTTERGEFLGFNETRYDIAHKLGYLDYDNHTYLNDCAVVFTNQPILLVMLTDNIYGGVVTMTEWCTLMCDYTNYRATLPPETPTPAPEVEPQATPELAKKPVEADPVTVDEAALKERQAVLAVCAVSAVVLIIAKLIRDVRRNKKKKEKTHNSVSRRELPKPRGASSATAVRIPAPSLRAAAPFGVVAVMTAALTIAVCIYASGATPRIIGNYPDPSAAAGELLAAMCDKNGSAGENIFAAGTLPELSLTPTDETAARVLTALRDSYSVSLGAVELGGVNASAEASLTRIDLVAVASDLRGTVTRELTKAVGAATDESEVYDAAGEYLPEFADRVFNDALLSLIGDKKYMDSVDFTLTMVYEKGRWLAVWDSALAAAMSGGALQTATGLPSGLDTYVTDCAGAALEGIAKVKKVYILSEDTVVAPEPEQSLFGVAKTPEEIEALLERAEELLDGQEFALKQDVKLFGDVGVTYYLDDTIYAACWKELINAAVYTFTEVKVAHASQFRRMIGGDEFGSELLYHPSDLAAGCNAVAALSGDYYLFRDMGIVVHKSELYRTRGDYIDTCMIDGSGDLNFVYAGEIGTDEEARAYIKENDIRFSLVFGPALVDNGEVVNTGFYPLGEVKEQYSRCGLGQLGSLHYLLCTANEEAGYSNVPDIASFAKVFYERGCIKAYALDGGQTGTMVMNDNVMNRVTFGYQRNISDIIFFATAMPERGGGANG